MFGLFNRIPSISTSELAGKLGKNLILLDVRTPGEYRGGHIASAKNVPSVSYTHLTLPTIRLV